MATEYLGNRGLLNGAKIGFLAPGRIAPGSVMPAYDWATATARREDVAVVSGFTSTIERDVLDFLRRGRCGLILVLVRQPYKAVPAELQPLLDANRLLVVFLGIASRLSRKTASQRNAYVASLADELILPCINPDSSLYALYRATLASGKPTHLLYAPSATEAPEQDVID